MSNNLSHIHLGDRDIFGLNKMIIDSFSEEALDKRGHKKNEVQNTCTSSTSSTTKGTSRNSLKWPLARPRMSVSFAAKYRDVNRRLQVKQLLQRINFDGHDSTTIQASQPKEFPTMNKKSSLEELKLELETLREHENRRPNWLCQGISVRVISARLGKRYLGKTADVIELKQDYTALIRFHRDGSVVYADQNHLHTEIIDKQDGQGSKVLMVNGAYRGCTGVIQDKSSNTSGSKENGTARNRLTVKIDKGVFNGRVLRYKGGIG